MFVCVVKRKAKRRRPDKVRDVHDKNGNIASEEWMGESAVR